ncbi:MAG: single-stranded-DNA-specific exonuclease RecJ [Rickettsiales bacterium]|jgi:single-stranded-DNA-specific exonuclease|nr:single-stranded-DNA-specific exonuclease RecJ [Rickettsiales bacterium]
MIFREQGSVRGYRWGVRDYDEELALAIYQKKRIPPTVSRLLAIRGVGLDGVDDYLNPRINRLLKDPYHLLDMDRAVGAIYGAILDKKKICIFGDYDVDGAAATALMIIFFRNIGVEVMTYIPDRSEDGYGLSEQAVEKLKQQAVEFIITVDCGVSCFEAVELANSLGIDVVITDHHIGSKTLPNAKALVNPNRLDEESEYKYLAGVGVAFMVCIALNTHLRNVGYYSKTGMEEQNLMYMLDLVALGTICDVMPLVNINRAFVRRGLEIFRKRTNLGLSVLIEIIGLTDAIDTYHLGYVLGPRINASGRVGDVSISNKLLSCRDRTEAKQLVEQLNNFNLERQNIEKTILDEAIGQVEGNRLFDNHVIFVEGANWHEGVIGIIASRIKDRYNRPVFIISRSREYGKASCRSVDKTVDIGSVIIQARENNLLISGGGHAMAGGFTFELAKLPAIKEFVENGMRAGLDLYFSRNEKYADLVLDMGSINKQLVADLGRIGPFGSGNPRPMIILENVVILSAKKFGKNGDHIRCIVGSNNMIKNKSTVVANIFRITDDRISNLLFSGKNVKCDLVGSISTNRWMNMENIQFNVEDIIPN